MSSIRLKQRTGSIKLKRRSGSIKLKERTGKIVLNPPNFDDMLLKQGLVAYYPFDGDVNDHSGNGNDGIIQGTPQFVEGIRGQAIRFDSTNTEAVTDIGPITLGSEWAISVWYRPLSFDSYAHIFTSQNSQQRFACKIGDLSYYKRPYFYKKTIKNVVANTNLEVGAWYHLVYQYSRANLQIYVNSNLEVSKFEDIYIYSDLYQINGVNNEFIDAEYDEQRIYNRALSHLEIQKIYELKV